MITNDHSELIWGQEAGASQVVWNELKPWEFQQDIINNKRVIQAGYVKKI